MGGHLGANRTYESLRERVYRPGLRELVTQIVKECHVCQTAKLIGASPRGPLKPILPSQPLELLTTDLMGPLPVTERGNKYILVICDHFSKWSQSFALRSMQADEVVHHIVGFWVGF